LSENPALMLQYKVSQKNQDTRLSIKTVANETNFQNTLTDSQGNCLCIYDKNFHLTSTALLQYLTKFKNSK